MILSVGMSLIHLRIALALRQLLGLIALFYQQWHQLEAALLPLWRLLWRRKLPRYLLSLFL